MRHTLIQLWIPTCNRVERPHAMHCSHSNALFAFKRVVRMQARCSHSSALFAFKRVVRIQARCSHSNALFACKRVVRIQARCSHSSALFAFKRVVRIQARCSHLHSHAFNACIRFPCETSQTHTIGAKHRVPNANTALLSQFQAFATQPVATPQINHLITCKMRWRACQMINIIDQSDHALHKDGG
jgi:hypothetical protein